MPSSTPAPGALAASSHCRLLKLDNAGRRTFLRGAAALAAIETAIREDPDVILDLGSLRDTLAQRPAALSGVLALWRQIPFLRAMRNGRVFFGTSTALLVPGPRVPAAAQIFFDFMHGDARPA